MYRQIEIHVRLSSTKTPVWILEYCLVSQSKSDFYIYFYQTAGIFFHSLVAEIGYRDRSDRTIFQGYLEGEQSPMKELCIATWDWLQELCRCFLLVSTSTGPLLH